MFKFLLYLFLFYVIFRLLFSRVIGGSRARAFYANRNRKSAPDPLEQEGAVTINPKVHQTKGNTDKSIGDYVDYEEIK